MRHLLTGAGAALTLIIGCASNGFAQSADNAFDAADLFTNRDLLAQSERDQRLWLTALALGISSGLALHDQQGGECIASWYFGDRAQSYADMRDNMERFPDHTPPTILVALARRACPDADL